MFGYVRPLKGELKVKEHEQFKAAYCGLCNTLKKRYGFFSRFLLNYDFTFLAMLSQGGSFRGLAQALHDPRCFVKKCSCVFQRLLRVRTPDFERIFVLSGS